jgi:hypothetical protein
VQWNASRVPSGDQDGYSEIPGRSVNCLGAAPSGCISHTFGLPARSDMNAIHSPLGDHAGE